MKIGVSSYSFSQHMNAGKASLAAVCTLAKEMGYDGIELLDLTEKFPAHHVEKEARALREHCEKIGLPIIAYTVGGDFLSGDPVEVVSRLKGQVDIAAMLGAPLMRHDVTRGVGLTDWRAAVREMAPYVRVVTAHAEEKGVRTCTENHGFFMQDAVRVEELMLAVDSPNYGWLVDIGNFACADEDSVHAVTIAAPYAIHVHAKDFLIKPADAENPGAGWFRSRQGRHLRGTVVGHGEIPLRACLDVLREAGYDGWLSYEFEGMEENIAALKAGLAYLRKVSEPA